MEIVPDYPLETARLLLRPFTRGDLDAVHAYRSRTDVSRFLLDGPMSREACAEAIQSRVGMTRWTAAGDRLFLAVERREDAVMMGEVVLILRDLPARQAEVGYIFHPAYGGQGYATEAARRLLGIAFDEAGIHRVYARCHPDNAASWKVMERLGMRREAHFREHALVKGAWDEELVYAILEDEWRTRLG